MNTDIVFNVCSLLKYNNNHNNSNKETRTQEKERYEKKNSTDNGVSLLRAEFLEKSSSIFRFNSQISKQKQIFYIRYYLAYGTRDHCCCFFFLICDFLFCDTKSTSVATWKWNKFFPSEKLPFQVFNVHCTVYNTQHTDHFKWNPATVAPYVSPWYWKR